MDRGRLRDRLADLSLEDDEADIYLTLLEVGTSKARTVAEEADIHRTTAYRILKDLADEGLVEVGVGRPMEFTPAPPDRLFEEMRRKKSRELERVDEVKEDIGPRLAALQSTSESDQTSGGSWRMIKGRESIVEHGIEVLKQAREEVRYLSTRANHERKDVEADWQAALADAVPHLDARFLLHPDTSADEAIQALKKIEGVELRFTDEGAQAQSALIDGEVFVWVVVGEEPKDDVALWSDAPDLYTSQRLLFDGLWDGAQEPKV